MGDEIAGLRNRIELLERSVAILEKARQEREAADDADAAFWSAQGQAVRQDWEL